MAPTDSQDFNPDHTAFARLFYEEQGGRRARSSLQSLWCCTSRAPQMPSTPPTIRVHSGLPRPLMAHLTENFASRRANRRPWTWPVYWGAAAALADSEMPPASALRKRQDPAKGPTDNPAQSSSSAQNPGQQQQNPPASQWNRGGGGWNKQQRRKDWDNCGPGDGLAPEPGGKAPAAGGDPARACSPPRENVFEARRRAFTGSNRARLLAYLRASERGCSSFCSRWRLFGRKRRRKGRWTPASDLYCSWA